MIRVVAASGRWMKTTDSSRFCNFLKRHGRSFLWFCSAILLIYNILHNLAGLLCTRKSFFDSRFEFQNWVGSVTNCKDSVCLFQMLDCSVSPLDWLQSCIVTRVNKTIIVDAYRSGQTRFRKDENWILLHVWIVINTNTKGMGNSR